METPTSIDYISIDHSQRFNNDDWPTAATGGVGGGLVGWLGGLIERRNGEEGKVGPLLCEYKNNVFKRNNGRFNRVYIYAYIVLAAVCIVWLGSITLFIYTHYSWNGSSSSSDDKPVFPEASKYEKLSIQRVRTVDYANYDNGKPLSNIPYSVEMSLNKNVETWDRSPLIWMWEEKDFEEEFGKFAALHNKSYDSKEEASIRYRIFKKNMYFIYSHNMRGENYKVRMNQFGDMTFDEFRSAYMGLHHTTRTPGLGSYLGADLNLIAFKEEDLPDKVDWRAKGCVTEVKDQKKCGSCWAFSVTGSLEGAYCAKTGTLLSLSEQELIDCSGLEGNLGCNGGVMDSGFKYVVDNKGMMCTESEYPYLAKQQKTCQSKKCTDDKELNIQGYKDVPSDNERALRAAVATFGSISVAIQADQPGFQFYSGGIYEGDCGTSLDHGVLVVGYGTQNEKGKPHDKKKDFFIIKNSWGKGWGEDGYIRLGRAKIKEGECGVLMAPSYPVVGNTK